MDFFNFVATFVRFIGKRIKYHIIFLWVEVTGMIFKKITLKYTILESPFNENTGTLHIRGGDEKFPA